MFKRKYGVEVAITKLPPVSWPGLLCYVQPCSTFCTMLKTEKPSETFHLADNRCTSYQWHIGIYMYIIIYIIYNFLVPWCGEICGEPSTDYSSGQLLQVQRPWAEYKETLPKFPML